jgi:hypothetical protein
MELLLCNNPCSSQLLASTLLDAWLSGDRYRLSWELQRLAALPRMQDDSAECDRMEILTGIAHEMRGHADLFVPRTASAPVGVWMDLLSHLSGRRKASSN